MISLKFIKYDGLYQSSIINYITIILNAKIILLLKYFLAEDLL